MIPTYRCLNSSSSDVGSTQPYFSTQHPVLFQSISFLLAGDSLWSAHGIQYGKLASHAHIGKYGQPHIGHAYGRQYQHQIFPLPGQETIFLFWQMPSVFRDVFSAVAILEGSSVMMTTSAASQLPRRSPGLHGDSDIRSCEDWRVIDTVPTNTSLPLGDLD